MTLNVLIVDDDKTNRALVTKVLGIHSIQSLAVSSGAEALEAIKEKSYDVVLLDVMMPKMDGFEVCRRIRADDNTRFLPVIMLTALRETEDRIKGIEAGCDDFLSKPFEAMELIARVKALGRVKMLHDELEMAESVVISLARAVSARDGNTGDHCRDIEKTVVAFGKYLGLSQADLKLLDRASVLHDIGKIGMPDSILLKPAKLTEDEWKVMRRHPVIGEEICRPLKTLQNVCPIIRSHHERWDGSGYPDGLRGEAIPYLARVFQIVDAYDALRRERPYKKAYSLDETIAILKEETVKGLWDAQLMDQFLGHIARTFK